MAYDLKTFGKIRLEGGGFTSGGQAKNNKAVVFGQINVTSYTTGGETVKPEDLGLATLDVVTFDVRTVNNAGTEIAAGTLFSADYINSSNKVLIHADVDAEVTSTQDAVVHFMAFGDEFTADLT